MLDLFRILKLQKCLLSEALSQPHCTLGKLYAVEQQLFKFRCWLNIVLVMELLLNRFPASLCCCVQNPCSAFHVNNAESKDLFLSCLVIYLFFFLDLHKI